MRICVLIDAWEPVWGGGQTHVRELTQTLAVRYGHEFDIFTRSLTDTNRRDPEFETNHHQRIRIYRIGPKTQFFNIFGRLTWLVTVILVVWKMHRQKPYFLIHAHAFSAGIPGKILGNLLHVPVIFTVHGSHNLDLGRRTLTAFLENLLLTKIPYDRVISVSSGFLKYPNVNSDIEVIPNGVTIESFANVRKFPKRSSKLKILWVGRFDQYKGLDILVRAFAAFLQSEKDTMLTLVGEGPEKGKTISLIHDLSIEGKIQLAGKSSHKRLAKYYQEHDIFVLPSLAEGQPIVLLEAWAARLPVIASDVGDNRQFIRNGVNGYLIRPGDVTNLVDTLVKAKRNPKLPQLGERGYALVKSRFTWKIIAKKYQAIYQNYERTT